MVVLGAAKFHAAVKGLYQGTLNPSFGTTIIEGALEWLHQLIVQRVRAARRRELEARGEGDNAATTSGVAGTSQHSNGADGGTSLHSQLSASTQHSFVPKAGPQLCHCALTHDQVEGVGERTCVPGGGAHFPCVGAPSGGSSWSGRLRVRATG